MLRGWGDALAWLGKHQEAEQVFSHGVVAGYWDEPLCRSVPELRMILQGPDRALRYFPSDIELMESVVKPIRELLGVVQEELDQALQHPRGLAGSLESAGLHTSQSWEVLPLMIDGQINRKVCSKWARTCMMLAGLPSLAVRNGQVKISMMEPGTIVRPHAGPSNARLRVHCGLVVPSGEARIRVGRTWRSWTAGECFVFDESCEHEVVIGPDVSGHRIVLIADVVNVLLEDAEDFKAALSEHATPKTVKKAEISQRVFHRRWKKFKGTPDDLLTASEL